MTATPRINKEGEHSMQTKRILSLLALLALAASTTACNTVEGAGRDIQGAGEKVEDTARDVRN
jgi:predicted small secreted protein